MADISKGMDKNHIVLTFVLSFFLLHDQFLERKYFLLLLCTFLHIAFNFLSKKKSKGESFEKINKHRKRFLAFQLNFKKMKWSGVVYDNVIT